MGTHKTDSVISAHANAKNAENIRVFPSTPKSLFFYNQPRIKAMMQKDAFHNLLLLVAKVAQARPKLPPMLIAKNLGKLQRLAVTLHGRYGEGADPDKVKGLEQHAVALGSELNTWVTSTGRDRGSALTLNLDGVELNIF